MLESVKGSRYHKLALFLLTVTGWAVQNAVDDGRIVAARVGHQGIVIPWYAATRIGSRIEDRYNQKIAGLLARWCEVNDGLIGGRNEN
jgi:hypothetical protein